MKITGKLVSAESISTDKGTIVLAEIKLVPREDGNQKSLVVPFTPEEFQLFSFGTIDEFEVVTHSTSDLIGSSTPKRVSQPIVSLHPAVNNKPVGTAAMDLLDQATTTTVPTSQPTSPLDGDSNLAESTPQPDIKDLQKAYGITDQADKVLATPKIETQMDNLDPNDLQLDLESDSKKETMPEPADTSSEPTPEPEAEPNKLESSAQEADPIKDFDIKDAKSKSSAFADFMNGIDAPKPEATDDATEDDDDDE